MPSYPIYLLKTTNNTTNRGELLPLGAGRAAASPGGRGAAPAQPGPWAQDTELPPRGDTGTAGKTTVRNWLSVRKEV